MNFRKSVLWISGVLFLLGVVYVAIRPRLVTTFVDAERVAGAHGIVLPASARDFQQRRLGWFLDHGVLSMFELESNDVARIIAQVKVNARNPPAKTGPANPCVNGQNVWPENAPTFVPGNRELDGLAPTWSGEATPIEMLSCRAGKGDCLHLEVWSVEGHSLIKLYTDWN